VRGWSKDYGERIRFESKRRLDIRESSLINSFSLVSRRRVDEKRNARFGLQKRRGAGLWKTAAQFPVGLPGYLRQPMVSQQLNAA